MPNKLVKLKKNPTLNPKSRVKATTKPALGSKKKSTASERLKAFSKGFRRGK